MGSGVEREVGKEVRERGRKRLKSVVERERESKGVVVVVFELENLENLPWATVAGWRSVQLQSIFDPEKLRALFVGVYLEYLQHPYCILCGEKI